MAEMNSTPRHLKDLSQRLCDSARNGTLSQSVLFVGREGIGEFSLIYDLAMTLLCENDMSACGKCAGCREVAKLYHPDFLLVLPFPNLKPESKKLTVFSFSDPVSSSARFSEETRDAIEEFKKGLLEDSFMLADFEKKEIIPVEVVKDLIYALAKKPLKNGRRVVGVLNVDKMAFGAADLFLKTVEEPPHNTHILLTTSRPDLLYPTLLSRTQRIKIPPVPEEETQSILKNRLELKPKEALFLARISGGSPGMAVHLHEHEIISRREMMLGYFSKLLARERMGVLINDIQQIFGGFKYRFDDIKIDFDIIEAIIHDLYLLNQNRLDNHFINIDIKEKLKDLKAPEKEVLDIWNSCCAGTRQAATVNNVSADAAMMFFFISCAEALKNLTRPKYTLP
jgi:DNA polymerase III delta prime subunit